MISDVGRALPADRWSRRAVPALHAKRASRRAMPALRVPLALLLLAGSIAAAAPAQSQPASAPSIDPALLAKMNEIDARASRIATLSADFEQKKFTALLRKPLVSSGAVKVKGSIMRWETQRPEQSVMLVTDKEFQIYYPAQKMVEVYSLDQQLGQLAASPLPRLAVLRDRFAFAQIPVAQIGPRKEEGKFLALKLTPIGDELRQHVQEVRVLLDVAAGYIVQAEFADADGDRTVISFDRVQVNAEVGDLELKFPPGTKVVRPLEGLPGSTPSPRPASGAAKLK